MTRAQRALVFNNFVFLILAKVVIYTLAVLPWAALLAARSDPSGLPRIVMLVAALIGVPLLVATEAAILCRLLPKPSYGKHELFSRGYYRALRLQEVHEIITSSAFLNNMVNRIEPLRKLVYKLAGPHNGGCVVVAPGVLLLDPYAITLGRDVFIGTRALLSAHIILRDRMWVFPIEIGDGVTIGADAALSCGVSIGNGAKLDYGVTVSEGCRLGTGVVLLRGAMLEKNVALGAKVVIGAGSLIGRASRVGDGAKIGRGSVLGANVVVPAGLRIPDGAKVSLGELETSDKFYNLAKVEPEQRKGPPQCGE